METKSTRDPLESKPVIAGASAPSSVPERRAYDGRPSAVRTAWQRFFGWFALFPLAGGIALAFRIVGRYQIDDLAGLRRRYRELCREGRPILICANHLTFIDSMIIIWALGSTAWYAAHYSKFSWNLPAGDFFKKKWRYRLVAYLGKCIFVHRDGTSRHRVAVLDHCCELLRRGEVVTIFPEGKRSRTGRVVIEGMTFGIGRILQTVPDCRVLAIYLRGDRQVAHSNYPARGSRFHIDMRVLEPRTELTGREGGRDLAMGVGRALQAMERDHLGA